MNPHPRMRKSIKWGGAVVTVLVVLAMLSSARNLGGQVWAWKSGWWVRLDFGVVEVGKVVPAPPQFDPAFVWPFGVHERDEWMMYCVVREDYSIHFWPLLFIAPAASCVALLLDMRADRQHRAGLCSKCHYDRTGLASGAICPECGTAPA